MRTQLTLASLLTLGLFGLAPRPAHAQSTCSTDSDCVKGFTCQVSGGTACGSAACPAGEKCEPQPSACVPEEYKSCQPGPCHSDSDCASGLVCYTHTESNCPPSACSSDQYCAPQPCEPKTESACVPRYLLPCTSANDCGAGFTCESSEQCACAGSVPASGPSGGGAPPAPPAPDCGCETGPSHCNVLPVNCQLDSDCSAGWTCAVISSSGGCAESSPEPNSGSGAQGGALPARDCAPSAELKQCVPPYYALVGGAKGPDRWSAGSPTLSGGDAASPNADAPPSAESGKNDPTSTAGCSVGHGAPAGSTLALFGAVGLFSALRRRRAR